jgi:peptide/nickel transport system permease protein
MSVAAGSRIYVPRRFRLPRLMRTRQGAAGCVLLLFVLVVALVGPLVAPHPLALPIGVPGDPPSGSAPLGTDFLGRDVLSRLLNGGLPIIAVSTAATALTYAIGLPVGMLAGLSSDWRDGALMRTVDLLIAFPALLVLLVLIAGAGTSNAILVLGIVLVLCPGVARIARTATLEVSTTGYLEAAVARGESMVAIMRHEVLPNIARVIVADAGVRFIGAAFLVASVNFLGLGSAPPAANWALMIAENRPILSTNVWSVAAPAIMLALLTLSVNMVGDAYTRTLDTSMSEE